MELMNAKDARKCSETYKAKIIEEQKRNQLESIKKDILDQIRNGKTYYANYYELFDETVEYLHNLSYEIIDEYEFGIYRGFKIEW